MSTQDRTHARTRTRNGHTNAGHESTHESTHPRKTTHGHTPNPHSPPRSCSARRSHGGSDAHSSRARCRSSNQGQILHLRLVSVIDSNGLGTYRRSATPVRVPPLLAYVPWTVRRRERMRLDRLTWIGWRAPSHPRAWRSFAGCELATSRRRRHWAHGRRAIVIAAQVGAAALTGDGPIVRTRLASRRAKLVARTIQRHTESSRGTQSLRGRNGLICGARAGILEARAGGSTQT